MRGALPARPTPLSMMEPWAKPCSDGRGSHVPVNGSAATVVISVVAPNAASVKQASVMLVAVSASRVGRSRR